ncbi:MAG: cytochrome c oxidase subunit I [Acidimicrobiales bacterium]
MDSSLMAIVTQPPPSPAELPPPPGSARPSPIRLVRRPTHPNGAWDWITTVDHKKIGIMYSATAFLFFIIGGIEALLLRIQLGSPDNTFLSAEAYNQVFTMHGTTMIFLVIMPLSAGLANYLLPIMVGARDVAFPRLNAAGYWIFLVGGLFMYSSFFLGGMPNGGWFGYTPLTSTMPGHNIDFWIFGLQILGIASLTGAVNLIVTVINLRAPGMSLFRMPIFVWMSLVAQFLLLFALPIITVALFLLMFDRQFGTNFFNIDAGGDPLLWQHLFWLFGHPEVYILILPAMGVVSEILPVFSRKPLFGYQVMVISGIAIGFIGWGVWVHHMFATGLGSVAISAFAASTMFIAVPTGVKIFNWIGTMWKGKIRITTPFLFAVGFVTMFTIGGLSGVTHAVVPADTQQTDTYYVVAHFHYVLFGGSIFGLFGGAFYWWPKFTGRMLSERLGKLQFWLMLLGFNMTFGPFHILGLQGMPRRVYTYPSGRGWDFWNLFATVGSFLIALAVLIFAVNVWKSRKGPNAGPDPWDARTLEWTIPSPPPHYNFAEVPLVTARDDFWHRKYEEDEHGRPVPRHRAETEEQQETVHAMEAAGDEATTSPAGDGEVGDGHGGEHGGEHGDGDHEPHIHMPSPSYWPIVMAFGIPVLCFGVLYKFIPVIVLGVLWILGSIYAWALEPATEPEEPEPALSSSTDLEPVSVGPGEG